MCGCGPKSASKFTFEDKLGWERTCLLGSSCQTLRTIPAPPCNEKSGATQELRFTLSISSLLLWAPSHPGPASVPVLKQNPHSCGNKGRCCLSRKPLV